MRLGSASSGFTLRRGRYVRLGGIVRSAYPERADGPASMVRDGPAAVFGAGRSVLDHALRLEVVGSETVRCHYFSRVPATSDRQDGQIRMVFFATDSTFSANSGRRWHLRGVAPSSVRSSLGRSVYLRADIPLSWRKASAPARRPCRLARPAERTAQHGRHRSAAAERRPERRDHQALHRWSRGGVERGLRRRRDVVRPAAARRRDRDRLQHRGRGPRHPRPASGPARRASPVASSRWPASRSRSSRPSARSPPRQPSARSPSGRPSPRRRSPPRGSAPRPTPRTSWRSSSKSTSTTGA